MRIIALEPVTRDFILLTNQYIYAFSVLHEVKNSNVGDVLLCGVLDGHGGTAASESVSKVLPSLFSQELELSDADGQEAITEALEKSWDLTCSTYRSLCENGECVVDYDPLEGILFAETGSKDLIGECVVLM
jgi:serine/threonine protein phosphatase PrpC